MSAPVTGRAMHLWWRCTLRRRRPDTFGRAHDDPDDVCADAAEALEHLGNRHDRHVDSLNESAALIEPSDAATRVARGELLRPFRPTARPATSDMQRPPAPLTDRRTSEAAR